MNQAPSYDDGKLVGWQAALEAFIRENNHPDCLPEMKFRYTKPDGTSGFAPTKVEAFELLSFEVIRVRADAGRS